MALVLGTNIGFLQAHQGDNPGGSSLEIHDRMVAMLHTSPALATRVTEINWYCNTATEEANYEVAIYSDDASDEPHEIVTKYDTNAKGTAAGWKRSVGLNIVITAETAYWIAIQVDDTPVADTDMDWDTTGATDLALTLGVSTLPADWGASTVKYSSRTVAIQAVWDTGAAGGLSIPIAMYHYMHNCLLPLIVPLMWARQGDVSRRDFMKNTGLSIFGV